MNAPAKPRMRAGVPTREPWFGPQAFFARAALVFLDFDGVLHPLGQGAARFERAPALLRALEAMALHGAPAKIALTTSWRFQPMEEIVSALNLAAPGLGALVEGRCGSIATGNRWSEALDYVKSRPGGPPRALAALDDQAGLYGAAPPPWLVLCDGAKGVGPQQEHRLASIAQASRPEAMEPIDVRSHPAAPGILAGAGLWRKKTPTLLRLAGPEDFGQALRTWVPREDGWEVELEAWARPGDVVARNPGDPPHNEWLIDQARARQIYGEAAIDALGPRFAACPKMIPTRAARLGPDEMAALGAPLRGPLLLATPRGAMAAREGDWLCDSGHSISRAHFADYEPWDKAR